MMADLNDLQRQYEACKVDRHATEQLVWHMEDSLKNMKNESVHLEQTVQLKSKEFE